MASRITLIIIIIIIIDIIIIVQGNVHFNYDDAIVSRNPTDRVSDGRDFNACGFTSTRLCIQHGLGVEHPHDLFVSTGSIGRRSLVF